ncbi:hypothetical protein Ahy_B01g055115 [Arachis hypogaea]|uniref:DUF4283 domain-containing protein n=1 Tax=Arachis hypogaea TaxID=3818 RepID=A0A445AV45_ARAHY|nr:hypothetical protein Ahy_B01g055115 [Arachis hypogaea]
MVKGSPMKNQKEREKIGEDGNLSSTESMLEEERIRIKEVEGGLFNIIISENIERKLWKSWWDTLIVKLLGRRLGYAAMKRRLVNMWDKKGTINVIDLTNDYYLVKFYANEDFDFALLEGS